MKDDSTRVFPLPLTSNIGFHPNVAGPRAGTIVPSVLPSKSKTSGGVFGSLDGPGL